MPAVKNIDLELFKKYYLEDNLPIVEIAKRFNISRSWATQYRNDLGLPLRFYRSFDKNGYFANEINISKEYLIDKYVNQQLTCMEIAKELNVRYGTIVRRLKEYEIPRNRNKKKNVIKGKRFGLNALDLTGQKFGSLTAIETVTDLDNRLKWKCVCDCGGSTSIRPYSLVKGITKSCKKCFASKESYRTGYKEINGELWKNMKNSARKRRLEFNITIEQIWLLFLKQNRKCAISGVDIKFSTNRKEQNASLDRIDSSKGYNINNVQWVHKQINYMKQSLSDEDFINWCRIVTNYNEIHRLSA